MCKELDISESKARKLIKRICNDLDLSPCNCWFIDIPESNNTLGWYSKSASNMLAYMMIEKNWSRRLVLVLHEITHHLQEEGYEYDSPHGQSFQLAKRRIATWAKNNISDHFDWVYMIQRYTQGRRKCKKKGKKKKKK